MSPDLQLGMNLRPKAGGYNVVFCPCSVVNSPGGFRLQLSGTLQLQLSRACQVNFNGAFFGFGSGAGAGTDTGNGTGNCTGTGTCTYYLGLHNLVS